MMMYISRIVRSHLPTEAIILIKTYNSIKVKDKYFNDKNRMENYNHQGHQKEYFSMVGRGNAKKDTTEINKQYSDK